MTATTTAARDLFSDIEADDAPGLKPGHKFVDCGTCGRELLTANLPGETPRGFKVTEGSPLPPLVFGWRVVMWRGQIGGRRVPICCGCAVHERRAARRTNGGHG